jgi:hypothetical protein
MSQLSHDRKQLQQEEDIVQQIHIRNTVGE